MEYVTKYNLKAPTSSTIAPASPPASSQINTAKMPSRPLLRHTSGKDEEAPKLDKFRLMLAEATKNRA